MHSYCSFLLCWHRFQSLSLPCCTFYCRPSASFSVQTWLAFERRIFRWVSFSFLLTWLFRTKVDRKIWSKFYPENKCRENVTLLAFFFSVWDKGGHRITNTLMTLNFLFPGMMQRKSVVTQTCWITDQSIPPILWVSCRSLWSLLHGNWQTIGILSWRLLHVIVSLFALKGNQ
jgi:hypothetical protein